MRRALIAALLMMSGSCGSGASGSPPRAAMVSLAPVFRAAESASPGDCSIQAQSIERPAPARLVAIGDVHGDLGAARAALRLAGAIDERDRWIGGALGVVQLGDVLDRGDDEQAIIDLFERLEVDAARDGGSFTWLLGNHELMNAAGDFRYVTPAGLRDFADAPGVDLARADRPDFAAALGASDELRARAAAMIPGGAYARIFAGQDIAVRVGETLFSHAGLSSRWAGDLAGANRSARCWLAGAGPPPGVVTDSDGPVWTREWGNDRTDCAALEQVLGAAGARRMVVAHTPQRGGITSACGGRLWRIDTGMSAHYGGTVQVLEIAGRDARLVSR